MSCSSCEPIGKGTLDNHKMLQENMRLLNQILELQTENARLREELTILSLYKNLAEQYGLSAFEDIASAQKDAERYRKFIAVSSLTDDDDPALHAELGKMPESPSKEDFDKLFDALPAMKEVGHG